MEDHSMNENGKRVCNSNNNTSEERKEREEENISGSNNGVKRTRTEGQYSGEEVRLLERRVQFLEKLCSQMQQV